MTKRNSVLTVGFADDEFQPTKYLLLQRGINADEQDRSLGQDTYYVEVSGQDTSFYRGVSEYALSSDQLVLQLEKSKHTDLTKLVIFRGVDPKIWDKLRAGLHAIFRGAGVSEGSKAI